MGDYSSEWYIDSVLVHESDPIPVNDTCADAIMVSGPYPTLVSGTTLGATFDCTDSLGYWNGVWYRIAVPNLCNDIEILISGLDYDLLSAGIILAYNCPCGGMGYIYADSSSFPSDTSFYMRFNAIEGPDTLLFPFYISPLQDFTFTIDVTDGCDSPSSLEWLTSTGSTANVTWTEEGCAEKWELEYGLYGFIPTGIPTDTGIISLPYTISGLIPGTCYQMYVRSVCSPATYSNWSDTLTFCTSCPATIDTFQYLYHFEAPVWPPHCWSVISATTSTWTYGETLQSPLTRLTFCQWDPSQSQNERLISPVMDLSAISDPVLSFNWMTSYEWLVNQNNADLKVYISLDGGTTWESEILWSEDSIGTFDEWQWYYSQVDLSAYSSATQAAILFRYTGTDGDSFALDNVMVSPASETSEWTGNVNRDWFNSGNWTNGTPVEGSYVTIPNVNGGSQNHPRTNNTVKCTGLQVQSGASLQVLDGTKIILDQNGAAK